MKIYTEINYKWLDGQLVKTSSKSFEYEGDLTLCGGGGGGAKGGGGGSSGGTLGSIVSSAADTATSIVTDPVGTTTDIIGDTITTAGESLEPAAGGLENILGQTGDVLNEGLTSGIEELGELGQPNLAQFGTGQGGTLGDLTGGAAYYGNKLNNEVTGLFEFIGEKGQELTNFIHGTQDPTTVTIDPDESAYSGTTANKKAGELAANKAKAQARSSLRINA
jgi:hypothetical protein